MTTAPVRVLIGDDDAMVRDALREVLADEADLEVVAVASDADEAIVLAEHHLPTVAVLDLRMPGGGGGRAAREIRLRSPLTRILTFSAYDDTDTIERLKLLGVTEHILKGVPNSELVAAIRRLGQP